MYVLVYTYILNIQVCPGIYIYKSVHVYIQVCLQVCKAYRMVQVHACADSSYIMQEHPSTEWHTLYIYTNILSHLLQMIH